MDSLEKLDVELRKCGLDMASWSPACKGALVTARERRKSCAAAEGEGVGEGQDSEGL